MSTTAFVLVLVLRVSSGTAGLAIDMPDATICEAAVKEARRHPSTEDAYCLTRTPPL